MSLKKFEDYGFNISQAMYEVQLEELHPTTCINCGEKLEIPVNNSKDKDYQCMSCYKNNNIESVFKYINDNTDDVLDVLSTIDEIDINKKIYDTQIESIYGLENILDVNERSILYDCLENNNISREKFNNKELSDVDKHILTKSLIDNNVTVDKYINEDNVKEYYKSLFDMYKKSDNTDFFTMYNKYLKNKLLIKSNNVSANLHRNGKLYIFGVQSTNELNKFIQSFNNNTEFTINKSDIELQNVMVNKNINKQVLLQNSYSFNKFDVITDVSYEPSIMPAAFIKVEYNNKEYTINLYSNKKIQIMSPENFEIAKNIYEIFTDIVNSDEFKECVI